MSGIAVYLEGGGNSTDDKATLRQGMSEFLRSLREAARQRRLHWKDENIAGHVPRASGGLGDQWPIRFRRELI
jgi:hypothetical protein